MDNKKLIKTPVLYRRQTGQLRCRAISGNSSNSTQASVYALDDNSYAWAWGQNTGDGVIDQSLRYFAVSVATSKTWIKLAGGNNFCVALDSGGYAWAWGTSTNGAMGVNHTVTKISPVSVVGGRQFLSIESAVTNVIALDYSSYAWAWGDNTYGQLGDNSVTNRSSPVSVVGGRQWIAISAGAYNSYALDANSYAYAWGLGAAIGNNAATNRSSPVSVVGGRQWLSVVGGSQMAAGLDNLSYAWAWGAAGANGDNSAANRSSPVSVVGGMQWMNLYPSKAGTVWVLALNLNSYAWAWGDNASGYLGDNTIISRSSPVSVVGGRQWDNLRANGIQSYGIASSVTFVWGANSIPAGYPSFSFSSPVSFCAARISDVPPGKNFGP